MFESNSRHCKCIGVWTQVQVYVMDFFSKLDPHVINIDVITL